MKFQGFVGPTYKLDSVNVDCQRCVNLYPEVIESGTGKDGNKVYFKSTPGKVKLFTVGTGPIRLIHAFKPTVDPLVPPNRVLVVSGSEIYRCSYIGGAWVTAKVGDLATSTGPVKAKSVSGRHSSFNPAPAPGPVITGLTDLAYLADGAKLYRYAQGWTQADSDPKVAFEIFDEVMLEDEKPSHVLLIDGFYIFNDSSTSKFFVSEWNSPAFNPLDFASSEGSQDNLIAMIDRQREMWLIGEKSIEVWMNTGNASFPFERIQGGYIEMGCAAPYSVAKSDGTILWLGRDESGQGTVYAAKGLNPQRISTHAVEQAISSYADISKATAFTYQKNGHSFYQLNFAEGSWVYDVSTGLWHERAYTNAGILERDRADQLEFFMDLGIHMVGDYATGEVYKLDEKVYTDDGDAITRMRISPHISAEMKRVFYSRMQLDMETGVGLDGNVQGSDPQVMLQFSNDGGHTWSSEAWVSAGKKIGGIGDFKKRVIWNRLGSAYDRVFKVVITDPVPVTIIGAELELTVGAS